VYRAQRIIREINAQLKGSSIPPLQLVMWRFMEGNYAWCIGAHEDAVKKFQAALEVTQAFGMPMFNTMLYGMCVYCALSAGDVPQAEIYLNKAEAANPFSRRYILAQLIFLRSGIALMKGDFPAALLHAQTTLEKTEPLGRPFITAKCRLGLAQVLIEVGDVKTAQSHLAQANAYARTMNSPMLELQCLLVEAYGFIKSGKGSEALEPLRKGLQIARAHDYVKLNDWWRPQIIASLLSYALAYEIEPLFVRSVIRRRRIDAIEGTHENWPWPVKVSTLGKFDVSVDDELVRFHRKSQHRPLELLQCLCALGGTGVHQDRVTEALWPDAEGDAAAQALKTTLHRLRKLLQHEQAIRLEDRQLFLDPRYIWVDCLAFERAVAEADVADRALLKRVMNLYHGHFLQGEQAHWALTYRERLRAHHMKLAERIGTSLEKEGNLTAAVECYLKAFEVEPVAEVFCRKIMIIYSRLGRRAEAVGIYQRFGHSLRSRLGINPTQETQALYHSLSND
ncbi:MAG TPA: bacterial transcriptional activator domain-containing protein, partial [Nitrospira sp.]|nr:bacterial transcriptional activator domain-containing protein [Nitrospira sp.]